MCIRDRLYDEKGVVPDRKIAGLLAAAIISDTLMVRSPTCTALDRATCERLADMAGINKMCIRDRVESDYRLSF